MPHAPSGLVPRALAALATVLAVAVIAAPPAAAHAALVGSTPAEGDTVTTLESVELEFNEQLLDIGNEVALEAPDGTRTPLEVDGEVTSTLTAIVPDGAAGAGTNLLHFRVVSADGHPIEGTVTFTYAPTSPSPAPNASESPAASEEPTPSASPSEVATAIPSATPSPSATAGAAQEGQGASLLPWLVGGAVAAAAVTAIALAARRGADPNGPAGQH